MRRKKIKTPASCFSNSIREEDLLMWAKTTCREPWESAGEYAGELRKRGEKVVASWGEGDGEIVVNGRKFIKTV